MQRHGPHQYECGPGPCSGLSRRERVKRARCDRDSIPLLLPGLTLGTPNPGRLTQRSQTSIADATSVTQGCHRTGHVHTDGPHAARPRNHVGQPRDARHTHCTALHSDPRLGVGTCRRGRGGHGGAATFPRRVRPGRVCRGTAHIGMSVVQVRAAVSAGGKAWNARDRDSIPLLLLGLTLGTPNPGRLTQLEGSAQVAHIEVPEPCSPRVWGNFLFLGGVPGSGVIS